MKSLLFRVKPWAAILMTLSLLGCTSPSTFGSEPPHRPYRDVEERLVADHPYLESITLAQVSFSEPVRVRIKTKAGLLLSRNDVLACVDALASEWNVPAENILLIDQMGAEHSSRLMREQQELVRGGQLLEHSLAEEHRLSKKAREALEAAIPGRVRVELSLSIDGWVSYDAEESARQDLAWSSRSMVPPVREKRNFRERLLGQSVVREYPNIIGGKVFLATNNLSEKELYAITGFVQDATGIMPLEFVTDNRPCVDSQGVEAPLEEPRALIDSGLVVAVLGLLGAFGAVRLWSRRRKSP